MLCHQQGKIGILRLLFRILVAVSVNSHYAVGIFIYHSSLGIHTEGTDQVAVLCGTVNYLALIKLVRQV